MLYRENNQNSRHIQVDNLDMDLLDILEGKYMFHLCIEHLLRMEMDCMDHRTLVLLLKRLIENGGLGLVKRFSYVVEELDNNL